MTDLIFATNNQHKLREVREILGQSFNIVGLREMNIFEDIPETQDTIEGNAIQKARYIYEKTGMSCFADDTGLEIDVLDGRPGVYSARYAGEGCSFADNVRKILLEMEGMTNRKAAFRCIFCLIIDGREFLFEGKVNGQITLSSSGGEGFGYDPVFLPDGYRQTFAEMPPYLKNGISHRGRAAEKMKQYINSEVAR